MKLKLALSAAALMVAQGASAATLDLTYNGFAPGYRAVTIDTTSVDVIGSSNVAAGGFKMSDSTSGGFGDFIAWCLDLAAYLGTSGSYEYKTTETPFQNGGADLMSGGGLARVASVFNANFGDAITASRDASAAFQLALWESVYDTDFNITTGAFKATSTSAVESLASGYLTAAANYTSPATWDLTYLESTSTNPRRQNLVTAELIDQNEPEPVPLPATGLLLLAGLGGLAASRRRNKG